MQPRLEVGDTGGVDLAVGTAVGVPGDKMSAFDDDIRKMADLSNDDLSGCTSMPRLVAIDVTQEENGIDWE
eukprot:SAG11_NODE_3425_length_2455_cov_1.747453_2_plen_70_part_01